MTEGRYTSLYNGEHCQSSHLFVVLPNRVCRKVRQATLSVKGFSGYPDLVSRGSNLYSMLSAKACQLASMIFSESPTVPHLSL